MKPSLNDVVEPVLAAHNLELEKLSTVRAGSRVVVRISVDGDGPDGHGPTLDDVATASSAISKALDESEAMGDEPYVLEVGSRGAESPLLTAKHWRRNLGRKVKITRKNPDDMFVSRIVSCTDEGVELKGYGHLAFADVRKATVLVEITDKTLEGE